MFFLNKTINLQFLFVILFVFSLILIAFANINFCVLWFHLLTNLVLWRRTLFKLNKKKNLSWAPGYTSSACIWPWIWVGGKLEWQISIVKLNMEKVSWARVSCVSVVLHRLCLIRLFHILLHLLELHLPCETHPYETTCLLWSARCAGRAWRRLQVAIFKDRLEHLNILYRRARCNAWVWTRAIRWRRYLRVELFERHKTAVDVILQLFQQHARLQRMFTIAIGRRAVGADRRDGRWELKVGQVTAGLFEELEWCIFHADHRFVIHFVTFARIHRELWQLFLSRILT